MSGFSQEEVRMWMKAALKEAEKAEAIGEVPIGAVIVKEGEIIGRGYNMRETTQNATTHAEMLAIQDANDTLGNWRLEDCHLFVTLEPCVMCSGAIVLSRIESVYYGPSDPKGGAVDTLMNVLGDERLNHQCEVHSGVMEAECRTVLTSFFRQLRASKKKQKEQQTDPMDSL